MNHKKDRKRLVINECDISWICLCFALNFMLCVFAPLEIYFSNKTEFWFNSNQLFFCILIVFLLFCTVSFFIIKFIKNCRIAVYIYNLLLCVLLFFYIQGNYIPRNYGVLDGVDINWNNYTLYSVASIILFFVICSFGIILSLRLKDKIYIIGKSLSIFLVLIQVLTIGTLYIQNNILNKETSNNIVVTTKDMLNLSDNKNILIFVLDTFDSYNLKVMLESENGNKYKEIFEDFTYYPDTLGAYPTTKGALPHILTGKWYKNEKVYSEYVKEAYIENRIYSTLNENDYSIGVYTSSNYLNPQCDMYANVVNGNYTINNYRLFMQKIYKLVAFNYMPHDLKKYFYITSADFEEIKSTKLDYESYIESTQLFYKIFQEQGIKLEDTKNSFRFYHLDGVHNPYTFDETFVSDSKKIYDVYDEANANFRLLQDIFNDLKEKEIYDKTTIIVMADHGSLTFRHNPLFMIKNENESHKFLISDKEMSYEYLSEIFISLSEGKKIKEEDIDELNKYNSERHYLYYSGWDGASHRAYLPNMTEYIAKGNVMEASNLVKTDKVYLAGDSDYIYSYHLNEKLSFGEEATGNDYCCSGFSANEGTHTWTNDTKASMLFKLDEEFENLELSMEYFTCTELQRVVIYANEKQVANYIASGNETKEIIIPGEYILNGELSLDFKFPDAISPNELGSGSDDRKLALAFRYMNISSTDKIFDENSQNMSFQYLTSTEILYSKENPSANKYCIGGFSINEDKFTWTDNTDAFMLFQFSEKFEDLKLSMEYFTYMESQQVIVYANGKKVEDYIASGSEHKEIIIPKEFVENNELLLHFKFPNVVSPSELGNGNDVRKLGLAFSSMSIDSISEDFFEEIQRESYGYTLGTELSFSKGSPSANKYCLSGFYENSDGYTWTQGNNVEMKFIIQEEFENLEMSFEHLWILTPQQVKIFVNDNEVANYTATSGEIKTVSIPGEYVTDGILNLRFELPNAESPYNLGLGEDLRVLSLAMKSLTIISISEN